MTVIRSHDGTWEVVGTAGEDSFRSRHECRRVGEREPLLSTSGHTHSTDQLIRTASNMAWKKGESGNPRGRAAEKPFADALRMEIKAAGGRPPKTAGDRKQAIRQGSRGRYAGDQLPS